jgi:adenosylmethionine-8-amino-7-oxononanoate aminotransferase
VTRSRYPFTATSGPTIASARDCTLFTATGDAILDAGGGAIVCNIGHGRAEVADAVGRALRSLDYVVPIWSTPAREALAHRLGDRWLPAELTRVFFTSGGSESVDSAVRLARLHHVAAGRPDRVKVIGRHPSYHGSTLATLAAGSHVARRAGLDDMLPDWPKVPWDDPDGVAEVIEREQPDTIAAFVAEPIIGAAGGALVADDAYWAAVSALCHRYGILLVADEVMTGLGRTGVEWAHRHWPFRPDIVAGAKGLGGGYLPIGLVAATEDVVRPIEAAGSQLMYFTYSAHDACCVAASEVLRILEDEGLVARAAKQGARLQAALEERLGGHPNVREIRGRGLMMGVELVADRSAGTPFPAPAAMTGAVVAAGLRRGVWFYPAGSGPVRDAILLGPPFIITDSEIDHLARVLEESIGEAVAAWNPS